MDNWTLAPRAQIGTRTQIAAEQLSRLVTENGLKAGDPLPSEESLAEKLAVSKRVVREALRILSAQGIVQTSQGRTAVVADTKPVAIEAYFKYMQRLDRGAALELYEFREIVETRATVLAASRATANDVEKMENALRLMEAAGDDVDTYVAGDLAFHTAIIDAAGNRFLSGVVNALAGALHEEREMGVRNRLSSHGSPRAIGEHRAILKAIRDKDGDEAERMITAHMKSGLTDFSPSESKGAETESRPVG